MTHPGEAQNHPNDRPQTVPNGHRPAPNRPGPSTTVHRVTVPEAAEMLGTTTDAVRSRMRRGKLRREAGEDGTVYVLLEGQESDGRAGPTTGEDGWTHSARTVEDGRETVEDGPPVGSMRDQVEYLRGQLEEAHAANRENRRIIAALTQRIPELEGPRETTPEPRDAPETVSDNAGNGTTGGEGDRSEPRRSWLYRFFFGG
jgi:hypothetical protein